MNRKYLLLLLCCLVGAVHAQTLNQAKQWFNEKKYEEAKPAFRKWVKQSPSNANYNYWYGVCCYQTGQPAEAESYLKKAAARNVIEAFRYLAETQARLYRFDEAAENMEKYIERQRKKKADTGQAERRLETLKQGSRMLKGTEQVTFIDSVVVDKQNFFAAYRIGPESGSIETFNAYFGTDSEPEAMLYLTELKSRIYYAQSYRDTLSLYVQDKLADSWSEAVKLRGLTPNGNLNYPYVLSDGITLYYASDGEGSIGGYDLFVTRYNSETNRYLRPENLGFPFSSPANDYLYVVDEYNNLGWFATDRNQPEGKVCVYVFIPNTTRVTFNFENTDTETVRRAAMIQSIAATQHDDAQVRDALQRLKMVTTYQQPQRQRQRDFEFVVNDQTTYYRLSDFRSPQAKKLFQQWTQRRKEYETLCRTLEEKRMLYHNSQADRRRSMTKELLELERRAERMEADLENMEINTRNAEIKALAH